MFIPQKSHSWHLKAVSLPIAGSFFMCANVTINCSTKHYDIGRISKLVSCSNAAVSLSGDFLSTILYTCKGW